MHKIVLDMQSGLYAKAIRRVLVQGLEERLVVREEIRKYNPDCKIVILVDDIADKALANEVKKTKKDGLIDAFLFGSATDSYLAAMMDSL